MYNPVLVTYASRSGSTAGVAEAIGETLRENGIPADVLPMQEVDDLTPYSAVVAGSAIQDGKWLPEAIEFVKSHQWELKHRPFAAFLVCMTLATKNQEYHYAVNDWLKPVEELVKPVSEGFFAGKLDIEKVSSMRKRVMFRASVTMGIWSEGDHRNWEDIHNWANHLALKFSH